MIHPAALLLALAAVLLSACKGEKRAGQAPSASARPSASAPKPAPSTPKPARPADAIAETGAGLQGIGADATHLFWVSDGFRGATKGILSVPKAGGAPTKLVNIDQALGLWVTAGELYYYDAGPELLTLPKTGGKPASLMKSDALGAAAAAGDTFCWVGPPEPGAATWASADPKRKEVFEADYRSLRCRKDGANVNVHVAPVTLFVQTLLVAGDQVFWPSSLEATIQAAPVAGGRERTVVREVNGVTALAANASSLFFVGAYGEEQGLFRVGKRGGTPKKLAALPILSRHVVADETSVYYSLKGGLWRVLLRKGEPEHWLREPETLPTGLVLDGPSLYLADGFYLRRLKTP